MEYGNGNRYDGDWVNDMKEGRGVLLKANRDEYEGSWKNDKKNGKGT
jgi:hypothetical protein